MVRSIFDVDTNKGKIPLFPIYTRGEHSAAQHSNRSNTTPTATRGKSAAFLTFHNSISFAAVIYYKNLCDKNLGCVRAENI